LYFKLEKFVKEDKNFKYKKQKFKGNNKRKHEEFSIKITE